MTSRLLQPSSLLARQYANSVNLKTLIDSFRDTVAAYLEDPADLLKKEATIEASGYWLDLLARRFGLERPWKLSGDAFFFGFAGNPQSTPFNQAPFRPDGDTLAGQVPIGDALFRKILKAHTSGLRSNGQQDTLNETLENVYPGSFVLDGLDMTMTLHLFLPSLGDDVDVVLETNAGIAKPSGVGLSTVLVNPFGFDGNGVGFDIASFNIT